jgi:uncharacterized protein YcbK (DUF882 family)
MNRRSILQWGALGALSVSSLPSVLSASSLFAAPTKFDSLTERSLAFHSLHTGENLKTVYWSQGEYIPDSLSEIHHILRDFRTGDVYPMDPRLLDLMCKLHTTMETTASFDIISGYRSPKTNAALHSQSNGVAENSLHLKGMATDLHLPGRSLASLRNAALSLRAGGVGYYPASQFVHVDVGRVRSW